MSWSLSLPRVCTTAEVAHDLCETSFGRYTRLDGWSVDIYARHAAVFSDKFCEALMKNLHARGADRVMLYGGRPAMAPELVRFAVGLGITVREVSVPQSPQAKLAEVDAVSGGSPGPKRLYVDAHGFTYKDGVGGFSMALTNDGNDPVPYPVVVYEPVGYLYSAADAEGVVGNG